MVSQGLPRIPTPVPDLTMEADSTVEEVVSRAFSRLNRTGVITAVLGLCHGFALSAYLHGRLCLANALAIFCVFQTWLIVVYSNV
jgi:hypothetical protein